MVFALGGRIEGERVAELMCHLDSEAADQDIVLDLRGVELVDRDAVKFLAHCAANGIKLEKCSGYIREWIVRENDRGRDSQADT